MFKISKIKQVAFATLITFFILVSCTIINGEKDIADENIDTEEIETASINKESENIIKSVEITFSTVPEIETTTNIVEETTIKSSGYIDLSTPSKDSFKSYMDYRTITDKTSKQYKLQKEHAYTEWHGIRMVDDRYCIAVGSYYSTTIGQEIDVILGNGAIIKCIVADLKDDKHTDSKNQQNPNGSVIEFIVDREILHEKIQKVGDISYFDKVWNTVIFSGEIKIIRVYKEGVYEF